MTDMKRIILLSLWMGLLPLALLAQDDMYFVPKKTDKVKKEVPAAETSRTLPPPRPLDVDVDEYNRHNIISINTIMGHDSLMHDSIGNDIIEFVPGDGAYPKTDTVFVYKNDDDFRYSARMGLFDDYYGWYNPYFYNYLGWRYGHYYGVYSPWYYDPWGYYSFWSPWFYDPWYYDPWYYGYWGGYGGWWGPYYSPYYGYYGYYSYYHGGYHHGGGGYAHYSEGSRMPAKSSPASLGMTRGRGYSTAQNGTFGGRQVSRGTFSGSSSRTGATRSTYANSGTRARGFGGSGNYSSSGSYSAPSRSSNPSWSTPYGGSSSYSGGSRSSGSSGSSYSSGSSGSSRSSSGGSFGGGGSRSGGSFGGSGRTRR